ncbi:hydrolase [Blastopirellula marina]|nr:hydrolase [Blastopirellula marina]
MPLDSEAKSILTWLETQRDAMVTQLADWAAINTGTHNLAGLRQLAELVQARFTPIADQIAYLPVAPQTVITSRGDMQELPLAGAIVGRRREQASRQAILSIHMDTVYPADSPFQTLKLDENVLHGPGVADAKGGLVVMLYALQAFERYVEATGNHQLGWTVLLNSDEEIGSLGSRELFAQYGTAADFGLLFEPCLPSGHLIGNRKGSGNFEIVVRGQAAHAGREFYKGRNAIVAAAKVARQLHELNDRWPDTTVNVAKIDGGGPNNVVPDLAVVRFNIRYPSLEQESELSHDLERIVEDVDEGIVMALHGGFFAPPKPLDDPYLHLLKTVQTCGESLGLDLAWESTGGVCDGNRLAALGVPNVDTMGVQGGNIHSPQEYMLIDSLIPRAQLAFLTLVSQAV